MLNRFQTADGGWWYPNPGDYAKTSTGTVYQIVKVNPKNTLCRSQDGKTWNVRGLLTQCPDPGWPIPKIQELRPGQVINVTSQTMYQKSWFRQYTTSTKFVVTKADMAKVNFVPLGAVGMPENCAGYSTRPDSVKVVDVSSIL